MSWSLEQFKLSSKPTAFLDMARGEFVLYCDCLFETLRSHKWSMLLVFSIGIVALGLKAFSMGYTGEAWLGLYHDKSYASLRSGRWMMSLLISANLGGSAFPGVSIIGSLTIGTFSAFLMACSLPLLRTSERVFFSTLLLLNPLLAEHYHYYDHCVPVALGMLFVALALMIAAKEFNCEYLDETNTVLQRRQSGFRVVCMGILLGCSIGVRQSFLLFAVLLFLGMLLIRPDALKQIKKVLTCGMSFVLALAVYFVCWKVVLAIRGLSEWDSPTYSTSQTLGSLFSVISENIPKVFQDLQQFYFEETFLFPGEVKVWFLCIFVYLLFSLLRLRSMLFFLYSGVLLLAMLLLPWSLALMVRSQMAMKYTAFLGLVPLYPIVAAYALALGKSTLVRFILSGVICRILFCFVIVQNAYVTESMLQNERDKAVASRFTSELALLAGYSDWLKGDHKVLFVIGKLPVQEYLSTKHSFLKSRRPAKNAQSIFSQNIYSAKFFLQQYLEPGTVVITSPVGRRCNNDFRSYLKQQPAFARKVLQASVWPDKNSIAIVDNIAFVKLQHSTPLCH